jgi:hypothetical protein
MYSLDNVWLFSLEDLFIKIASHSYVGDIRMGVAEDRNKIQKLVSGAMNEFAAIVCHSLKFNIDWF